MVDRARAAREWAVEVGIDAKGEITSNVTGLDEAMRANCRLVARGEMPAWAIVAVAATPEAGQATADALAAAIRERQTKERHPPQPAPAPSREPGEGE